MLTNREKDEAIEILINTLRQSDVLYIESFNPGVDIPVRDGCKHQAGNELCITITLSAKS